MFVLPIKKNWFDLILSGEKKEEYRTANSYYYSRFKNLFGELIVDEVLRRSNFVSGTKDILIRNGYSSKSPTAVIRCCLDYGVGKFEWGWETNEKCFILRIKKAFLVDSTLDIGVWKKVSGGYFTPGGDPLYECPFCGEHHIYGIESDNPHIACENCHRLMSYS